MTAPKIEETALPVTIIRENSLGVDFVTQLVMSQVRVWAVRRALRRFFPDREFSYRDVMVGVGAVRWLLPGSDYSLWSSAPLGTQEKFNAFFENLGKKL